MFGILVFVSDEGIHSDFLDNGHVCCQEWTGWLTVTRGIVASAMQGFWDMLVGGARFWACRFEIWDRRWGHVGEGFGRCL